jgi:hypothetical protein
MDEYEGTEIVDIVKDMKFTQIRQILKDSGTRVV